MAGDQRKRASEAGSKNGTRAEGKPVSRRSSSGTETQTKVCAVCGRRIEPRRKWAGQFDEVKYCSDGCRRRSKSATARRIDADLEATIIELLESRARGATICPSEAARQVAANHDLDSWNELMEPARSAARRLVASGAVVITQKGQIVDPSHAKGPIRIRKV
jgi:hypothetical protein